MATEVGEAIKVMAVFDKGAGGAGGARGARGVRPVKFRWNDRVYPVREITYTWKSREGSAPVLHFAVTDGATLFELSYNLSTMRWALEQVE